jgi:exosome complex component MTR3
MGQTKVICAVFGPRELTKNESYSDVGKLSCEVYFASSCRPQQKSIFKTEEEKELGDLFENALSLSVQLHLFPKSVIEVKINFIYDDGSFISTALTRFNKYTNDHIYYYLLIVM